MAFGMDQNGFTRKRLDDILSDLKDAVRANIGPGVRTDPRSVMGTLLGIVAGGIAESWELASAAYYALDPSQAEGVLLGNLARIIGLTRLPADPSTVTLTVSGTDGTTIPSGAQVSQSTSGFLFETLQNVTIDATGSVDVPAESVDVGPIEAPSGSLTVIETPVSGWDSVTNALDAELGRLEETDSELRRRMKSDLEIAGLATPESIRARLVEVEAVSEVRVIENDLLATDADGRPGKSYEVLILGGDDTEVAESIWESKPAGIEVVSTVPAGDQVSVTVKDGNDVNQSVIFSRPTAVPLYLDFFIYTTDAEPLTQADIDAVVERTLEIVDTFGIGDTVFHQKVGAGAFAFDRAQEYELKIGLSQGSGNNSNFVINSTEVATFDSSRITVSHIA